MERCCYVLLRRRHDVPIKLRGEVPLRRLGNVPLRCHWVFHLRCTCEVAGDVQKDVVTMSPWRQYLNICFSKYFTFLDFTLRSRIAGGFK